MGQSLKFIGAQVFSRIDRVVVDFGKYVVNRENHEGQEVINHTQYDRPWSVDDGNIRQVQKVQNAVDNSVFLQQRLPCQCAQQEIHPHRKNENEYHKASLADILPAKNHGQRVSQDKADQGACLLYTSRVRPFRILVIASDVILASFYL